MMAQKFNNEYFLFDHLPLRDKFEFFLQNNLFSARVMGYTVVPETLTGVILEGVFLVENIHPHHLDILQKYPKFSAPYDTFSFSAEILDILDSWNFVSSNKIFKSALLKLRLTGLKDRAGQYLYPYNKGGDLLLSNITQECILNSDGISFSAKLLKVLNEAAYNHDLLGLQD